MDTLYNHIPIPNKDSKNIYTSYLLNQLRIDLNTDFPLGSSLFGPAKLTKNADRDK